MVTIKYLGSIRNFIGGMRIKHLDDRHYVTPSLNVNKLSANRPFAIIIVRLTFSP